MNKATKKQQDNKKKNPKNTEFSKLNPIRKQFTQSSEETPHQFEQDRPKSLEAMMIDIKQRQHQFEQEQILLNEQTHVSNEIGDEQEKSRKTFYREFKKVVDASDIIIEVLDARDPLGCRCLQVEEIVLTSGKNKKLILLLNKIDLIPRDNLDKWLKFLRNEFPTVAFRASTQNQRDRFGHMAASIKMCNEQLVRTSNKCIGASALMNLLSNYCRKNDIKTNITVGIVGFPNVGKSSVINSLKRSQSCQTGSTPGITKHMQTVKLDKLIKLLDSPGIVMSKDTDPGSLILRNCVRIETIDDPLPAIELLIQRCTKGKIMQQYNIDDFQDSNELLSKMAVKMGSLRKGGQPDIKKTAQRMLSDWVNGRLTYFTEPPERLDDIISTELVTQMQKAFDMEALLNNEDELLNDLENTSHDEPRSSQIDMVDEDNVVEDENQHIKATNEDDGDYLPRRKPSSEFILQLDSPIQQSDEHLISLINSTMIHSEQQHTG